MCAEQFSLFDAAIEHPLKSKIQFRFLTELTEQNLNTAKTLIKRILKLGFNFKGRNPDLGLQLSPRMVIRDDKEIIFFITLGQRHLLPNKTRYAFGQTAKPLSKHSVLFSKICGATQQTLEKRLLKSKQANRRHKLTSKS